MVWSTRNLTLPPLFKVQGTFLGLIHTSQHLCLELLQMEGLDFLYIETLEHWEPFGTFDDLDI
jgi:hypothetical protein